jgi:osmotically-inducible protein OsmY
MSQILTRALLVAAALGSTVMAGCASDNERDTPTPQPAASRQPAAPGQPAAAGQQTAGEAAVDDDVVTAKVKARLVDDEVTKAYQINVETFKGTVQLSGSVGSEEARSRATELAKNVGGVKDVKNSLQIRKSDG